MGAWALRPKLFVALYMHVLVCCVCCASMAGMVACVVSRARFALRLSCTWVGVASTDWRWVRLRDVDMSWSAGAAGWAGSEEGGGARSMTLSFQR